MRRRATLLATTAVVLALAGCGSSSSSSSSGTTGTTSSTTSTKSLQLGFEGVPIEQGPDLASAGTTQTGTVDGIACGATEQLAYHIHAHLQVYVGGQSQALPGGIGIPGSVVQNSAQGPVAAGGQCIYWLHTHAPDGIIHIESPTQRIYTLGQFFDEWHQPLTANDIAGHKGKLTATVNGKPWTKNVRDIPLDSHAVIQISVGQPVAAFQTVKWSETQL